MAAPATTTQPAPRKLSGLETALVVVGIAGAGALLLYAGAKLVQLSRADELKRLGAAHVHKIGLTGVAALLPLPSGNLALAFRGIDGANKTLDLGERVA